MSKMQIGQSLNQSMKQEQIIAPQQIQSLEMLLAPVLELQQKISEELEENPVLEQEKSAGEDLAGDILGEAEKNQHEEDIAESSDEEDIAELIKLADSWRDSLPATRSISKHSSEDEEKRQHFLSSLTNSETLQDQLIEQLHYIDLPKKKKEICEMLIGSISENGYLETHLADIVTVTQSSNEKVEEALKIIHSFEPPGVGARNIKECLMLQLRRKGMEKSSMAEIIRNHLDQLASNKLPEIASQMNMDIAELKNKVAQIKKLNPLPGNVVQDDNTHYVLPEVLVEEKNGEFEVIEKNEYLPALKISQTYMKILEDPNSSQETREYIREKLLRAKTLMKSIENRQSTIKRIADIIVGTQHDFFMNGVDSLRPMTMQQTADKLGIHETTVSRTIANKYMDTPQGILSFKFFFSTGFVSDEGEELSNRTIKEKLELIVMKEDKSKPLSDRKLLEIFKKEGIKVARRTITKYREELGIPSSRLRKEY